MGTQTPSPQTSVFPPVTEYLFLTMMSFGLWSAGVSSPDCVPSQTLAHPQPTRWVREEEMRKPWHCASPVQQQLPYSRIINTVLATNAIWAAQKKVMSAPTSLSTTTAKQPCLHEVCKLLIVMGQPRCNRAAACRRSCSTLISPFPPYHLFPTCNVM